MLPLAGACTRDRRRRGVRARGPRRASSRARQRLRLRPARRRASRSRRRPAAASRCPSARAERRLEPRHVAGRRRAGRAARRRPGEPPGQQLLRARGARRRPPDRRRGAHAGRQLVLLSAAQARRGRSRARRWRSRRSTTSRSRGGGFGYQRVYGARASTSAARSARGDAVLLPARLPRPVDGRPGLRPLLPERDGRAGERAWRFPDDPAHAWIRATWADQEIDPRLPMTRRPA